jgi:hypothetical protein
MVNLQAKRRRAVQLAFRKFERTFSFDSSPLNSNGDNEEHCA